MEYQILRMYCSRLGHKTYCSSAFYTDDLNVVAGFIRELSSSSVVEIRTNTMIRGLLSACEEIPVDMKRGVIRHADGKRGFEQYSRFTLHERIHDPVVNHMKNKSVLFVGVSPSVIGDTLIQVPNSSATHLQPGVDYVFVGSAVLWSQINGSPYSPKAVYSQTFDPENFPDWQLSKLPAVGAYKPYERKQGKTTTTNVQVGQLFRGKLHPPSSLAPYLDTNELGGVLQKYEKKVASVYKWFLVRDCKALIINDPTYLHNNDLFAIDRDYNWTLVRKGTPSGNIRIGNHYYGYYAQVHEDMELFSLVGTDILQKKYEQLDAIWGDVFEVSLSDIREIKTSRKKGKSKTKSSVQMLGRLHIRFKNQPVPLSLIPYLDSLSHSPFYAFMVDNCNEKNIVSAWDSLWRIHSVVYEDTKNGKKKVKIDPHDKGVARSLE